MKRSKEEIEEGNEQMFYILGFTLETLKSLLPSNLILFPIYTYINDGFLKIVSKRNQHTHTQKKLFGRKVEYLKESKVSIGRTETRAALGAWTRGVYVSSLCSVRVTWPSSPTFASYLWTPCKSICVKTGPCNRKTSFKESIFLGIMDSSLRKGLGGPSSKHPCSYWSFQRLHFS